MRHRRQNVLPDRVVVTDKVDYADLDLDTRQGAATLSRRLTMSADHVCGGRPTSTYEFGANEEYATCVGEAVSSALRPIDQTRLYATAEGRKLLTIARAERTH